MAKVLFGGGIMDARRSIGGNTFSRNKGGSYMRQRVTPINPQTVDQINKREILSDLAKDWGTVLTEAQRDSFTNFAELNPRTDVLGQAIILSGIQMYISLSERNLIAGRPKFSQAPLNQDVTQLTTATATFDIGLTDAFDVAFTPTVGGNEFVQVFATPQLSPGVSFIKNRLRLIITAAGGAASPIDALAAWQTKFGSLPLASSKIGVTIRVLREDNAAISVPLRADTIVVST